jgi:hypothetical protein
MTVKLLVYNPNIQCDRHGIIQLYVISYVTLSVNRSQMAIRPKTSEIQTWKIIHFLTVAILTTAVSLRIYVDCHQAGLCCYLVMHIGNL